ncbi:uncharacterized protein K452DRAFT_312934 [Aplosporella prunicola CBS 121167]|uniref:G-patch domain-containing protein n=1 Tax=Aplosporella prunicola CBS 121167 TaxID=1176127 RepID=A0A6A6AY82_9PEZI|nr:uncharacterized protein K452DRAFT_312934 [Aplosporella prunicola CBS 121167]KAF2136730.1 hypothetical protein K452DRAFT_312934 [Aplosporella prunicola CBS 121167]
MSEPDELMRSAWNSSLSTCVANPSWGECRSGAGCSKGIDPPLDAVRTMGSRVAMMKEEEESERKEGKALSTKRARGGGGREEEERASSKGDQRGRGVAGPRAAKPCATRCYFLTRASLYSTPNTPSPPPAMDRPPAKRRSAAPDHDADPPRKAPKTMSFAQRMMAKMGYKEGQGLGKTGEGIINPIEVKLRPQGAGVGAVKEKTAQAKQEARRAAERRGEQYEDSSEEERRARRKRKAEKRSATTSGASTPAGSYGRQQQQKTKFRTAADLEKTTGLAVPNVLKTLIDATGRETRLLTSTAGLMTPVGGGGEADKVAKRARVELEAFADSWTELTERRKFVDAEEAQLLRELDEQAAADRKLGLVAEAVDALSRLDLARPRTAPDALAQWETVVAELETLQFEFRDELLRFGLHDVAVAAIAPLFKQEMLDWEPLEKPMHLVPYLHRLRTILGININNSSRPHRSTTAYETLIYTLWLPKVRTCITNAWDPHTPTPLIALVEAWKDVLPPFVHYGLLNNLIVTKLKAALHDWNPRLSLRKKHSIPLPHVWLFPWLQYLSDEHTNPKAPTGLLTDVRHKFAAALKSWDLTRGVLPGLDSWREVLPTLEHTLIRYLLPRLSAHLHDNFSIDPSDQDLAPLTHVLAWTPFFRPSTLAHLLEAAFFPKWLSVLHLWLTSEPDYDEVGQWFSWWKAQLPDAINAVPAVARAWDQGLELMNAALDLGEDAKTALPAPELAPLPSEEEEEEVSAAAAAPAPPPPAPEQPPDDQPETTFKDVVEDWCHEHDVLLVPLREADAQTGAPLFRITASAAGRGGVVVFLRGDVVFEDEV